MRSPSNRFTYLLLLLSLWHLPPMLALNSSIHQTTSYAQSLTQPQIGEASTQVVNPSKISLEQWQNLQAASSQNLLSQPNTVEFLKTNFNVDGDYGELKSGALVDDWDALAKPMGSTGLALAGAYAIWRRRRAETLKKLRAGDSTALEKLFTQSFGTTPNPTQTPDSNQLPQNHGSGLDTPSRTPLSSTPPPHNSAEWEVWGQQQGLLASGATLGALFSLWKQRQAQPAPNPNPWHQYFSGVFKNKPNTRYHNFYNAVRLSTHNQQKLAEAEALAQFKAHNTAPPAPLKSRAISQYEKLNVPYMRADKPYHEALHKQGRMNYYDKRGRLNVLKTGITNLWQQYYYYQQHGNRRGMSVVHRRIKGLIQYTSRLASPRQRWEIQNLATRAKRTFSALQAQYQNYQRQLKVYAPLKAVYEQQKQAVLQATRKPFQGWHQHIRQWWQQTTKHRQQKQQWLTQLNNLRTQNSAALTAQAQQAEQALQASMSAITQSLNADQLKALIQGKKLTVPFPKVSPLSPSAAASHLKQQLADLEIEKQHPATRERFEDEQARSLGYRVVRGRNGRRYYYRQHYNARYNRWEQRDVRLNREHQLRAIKARDQVYAHKAQTLKQRVAQQVQRYQLNQLQTEVQQTGSSPKAMQRLVGFLQAVQREADRPLKKTVWQLIDQLHHWEQQLKAAQTALTGRALSWPEKTRLEKSIGSLQQKIATQHNQLYRLIRASLAPPSEQKHLTTQAALKTLNTKNLENNPVYQHLQTVHRQRAFYKTYGQDMSVLKSVKDKLEAQLTKLAYLEGKSAYRYGYAYYDYQALKKDYQKVLNNELPDVYVKNWSWYNSGYRTKRTTPVPNRGDSQLHDWYHKSKTVFNRESRARFKAQYEARKATLFTERAKAFDQKHVKPLKEIFTAAEITEYQALLKAQENSETTVHQLKKETTAANKTYQAQVHRRNTEALTAPVSIKQRAIQSLNKSAVQTITLNSTTASENKSELAQTIPPQFLEPLWQAYRRYNQTWEKSAFAQEVLRLTKQAEQQYKIGLIADSGLPPEPAQSKTVRDYLEDSGQFNRAIDQQIKTIQDGIPLLHQKYAGQAYLNTAVNQAQQKIAALKRYRQSGPKQVAEYQQALAQWKRDNAYILAQIETGTANHFKDIQKYIPGYWQQAEKIAESKATAMEAESIIDTRDSVQLVESSPWTDSSEDPQIKAELKAFISELSKSEKLNTPQNFLLSNKTLNSQAKIYKNYQEKFLRSQGLTWDKVSNERIQKLHPDIRQPTIDFINSVADKLNIKLRITQGLRTNTDQLKLYCNSRNTEYCKKAPKLDGTSKWKTNAKPGESYHNYGLAVDLVEITARGEANWKLDWNKIARVATQYGFSHPLPKKDRAHFIMNFGLHHSTLKTRLEEDKTINGYVDLGAYKEVKNLPEKQAETKSFTTISQEFSEAHFQVWRKLNHKEDQVKSRKEFLETANPTFWQLIPKGYKEYLKMVAGTPPSIRKEMEKVFHKIILYSKLGLSGDIAQSKHYLKDLKAYSQHQNISYKQAAHFAADAYGKEDIGLWGFKEIKDPIRHYNLSKDLKFVDPKTGLITKFYEDDQNIVVSYAGTQDLTDWVNNFKQGTGLVSEQYYQVTDTASEINSLKTNKNIIFTGHSLGGGLAALSGAITGNKTITFNAAGVHPATLVRAGIKLNMSQYAAAFGGPNLATINKILKTQHLGKIKHAELISTLDIPNKVMEKISKNFNHIENHVTRGDLLTDMQEGSMLIPVASGNKIKHGSVVNNLNEALLMTPNLLLKSIAIKYGILNHQNFPQ